MNKKVLLGVEIVMVLLYIFLVIFIFDTSKTTGLIQVGVLTVIIFPLVVFLERKREKGDQPQETIDVRRNINFSNQSKKEETIVEITPKPTAQTQPKPAPEAPRMPIRNINTSQNNKPTPTKPVQSTVNTAYKWRQRP